MFPEKRLQKQIIALWFSGTQVNSSSRFLIISFYTHRLCMHTAVVYISWVHEFLTRPCIPYVGMMYGHWQQSLTLYAQLLFAPAVNPEVQRSKQKERGCVWGVWAWHKVKAIVDLICGFIQIAQIEYPFVTEYFTEIMYAATNVHIQQQYMAQIRDGRTSFLPGIQALTFRCLSSLNDQVTPYWLQQSFKAKNLKPCVAHSMTFVDSNVVGNGSQRIWWTSARLATGFWIRVSDSCRTMLMATLL